jgi:thiamine pyrophosphate-dependent acetolactate synthase large subunit-like protein
MMANGYLWTAAHHRIPLLTVMHNNRAYHQEIMQLQRVANWHNRGVDIDTCKIGAAIENPNIDYTMLAKSMGVQAACAASGQGHSAAEPVGIAGWHRNT